jgi:hypothetical protein
MAMPWAAWNELVQWHWRKQTRDWDLRLGGR